VTAGGPVRWGVIGATSWVARVAVLPAMRESPLAEIVAVASRDPERGRAVAARLGARAHARYEEVLADPDVEAVYLPLPTGLHARWTERAAAAGRHVLCEKPLARGAAEAAAMHRACEVAGVRLLEAYMTAFHPRHRAAVELARSGGLGEVRSMRSLFTFPLDDRANHRWAADMGGGALLDVGVYCLTPLLEVAGRAPLRVAAVRNPGGDGVDAALSAWLDFGGGLAASVECSFEAPERQLLEVAGTEAVLTVDRPFTCGPADTALHLLRRDGRAETRECRGLDPYREMVDAVWRELRTPGAATAFRGAAEGIAVAALCDRLRAAAALDERAGADRSA
jgi:D-xylose 1-dehydrogenase (NADP+, D-xylono-1,5-lactone-forming)